MQKLPHGTPVSLVAVHRCQPNNQLYIYLSALHHQQDQSAPNMGITFSKSGRASETRINAKAHWNTRLVCPFLTSLYEIRVKFTTFKRNKNKQKNPQLPTTENIFWHQILDHHQSQWEGESRSEEASTMPELSTAFQVLLMATAILVNERKGGVSGWMSGWRGLFKTH